MGMVKFWRCNFWSRIFFLAMIALGAVLQTTRGETADTIGVPKLSMLKHWGYQLQKVRPSNIARSHYDVIVMDYSRDGTKSGAWRRAQISPMKKKPNGSRRIVLAYLSIGEAEDYRFYWQSRWHDKAPVWLMDENPQWPGNYPVKFWHKGWQKIIGAYLEQIIKAGFDGVYLDRIDSFEEFKSNPKAEQQMIAFVRHIAQRANRNGRKFFIVPQNAESLLRHETYRSVLSGVAKEDFLFGIKGDGQPNNAQQIFWSGKYLSLARKAGLPVLAIEYLSDKKDITNARQKLKSRGFVPTFSRRKLDRPSLPVR